MLVVIGGPVACPRRAGYDSSIEATVRSMTLGFLLLSLVAGCSSTEVPARAVRVTRDRKEVAGCRLVGEVTSRTGWGDLKRQARRLGGNVVYVVSESVSVANGAAETGGIVYLCSSR
jgi:hypothetical protein